eukprot:1191117-Prorocentrum_minimum.AAC.1
MSPPHPSSPSPPHQPPPPLPPPHQPPPPQLQPSGRIGLACTRRRDTGVSSPSCRSGRSARVAAGKAPRRRRRTSLQMRLGLSPLNLAFLTAT